MAEEIKSMDFSAALAALDAAPVPMNDRAWTLPSGEVVFASSMTEAQRLKTRTSLKVDNGR